MGKAGIIIKPICQVKKQSPIEFKLLAKGYTMI